MSKDYKLNAPSKGNYGLGSTTSLGFQLSKKKLSSNESVFDKESNVKKTLSHDENTSKSHKIKIKTVFNLPNNSHASSSGVQEFYDPFNPTDDDLEKNELTHESIKKQEDVYDPFNPTYSDESETDPKSPPSFDKVPSPEPSQEMDDEDCTMKSASPEVFGTFSKPKDPSPENLVEDVTMEEKVSTSPDSLKKRSPSPRETITSPRETNNDDSNKYKWAEEVLTKISSSVNEEEEDNDSKVERDVDIFADEDSKKEASVESNESFSTTGKVKLPNFNPNQDSTDTAVKFKKLSKKSKVSVFDDKDDFEEEETVLPSLTVHNVKNKEVKKKDDHKSIKRKRSKDRKRSPSPSSRKKYRHRSKSPQRRRRSRSGSKSLNKKRKSKSLSKSRSPRRRRRSRSRSTRRRRSRSRRRRSRSRSKAKQRRRSRKSTPRSQRQSKSRSSSRRRRKQRSTSKDKTSERRNKSQSQRKSETKQKPEEEVPKTNVDKATLESVDDPKLEMLPDSTQELHKSSEIDVTHSLENKDFDRTPSAEVDENSLLLEKDDFNASKMDVLDANNVPPQEALQSAFSELKDAHDEDVEKSFNYMENDTIDIFNSSPVASSKFTSDNKEDSVKKLSKKKKKKKKSARAESPLFLDISKGSKSLKLKETENIDVGDDIVKEFKSSDNDEEKLRKTKSKSPTPPVFNEFSCELPPLKEVKHKKKKHTKENKKTSPDKSQKKDESLDTIDWINESNFEKLKQESESKELELIAARVRSKKSKHKLQMSETKVDNYEIKPITSKDVRHKSYASEDETKVSKRKKKKKHSTKDEHYSSDELKTDKKHKSKKQKKKKKNKHTRSDDSSGKDEVFLSKKKSIVDELPLKDEQNTPSDFDEIDAALEIALNSEKKSKSRNKKKKRSLSEESLEYLNDLFQAKELPKSGEDEDVFPLTKSPIHMDIAKDQIEDERNEFKMMSDKYDVDDKKDEMEIENIEMQVFQVKKPDKKKVDDDSYDPSDAIENIGDSLNFDDDMFADSPGGPSAEYQLDDSPVSINEEQSNMQNISEKRTNITIAPSLDDIFDLSNDSNQEPPEVDVSSPSLNSPSLSKDVELSPDLNDVKETPAHFSPPSIDDKNYENIIESPVKKDFDQLSNEEDIKLNQREQDDVIESMEENPEDKSPKSETKDSELKEEAVMEIIDLTDNKSVEEDKKSISDSHKSSKPRRRSRSKSKESKTKSRSRRSRSRGRNDRSRNRRSKSRERRKSRRSKSKERKRSVSKSRDRKRSRSKSRDRKRRDIRRHRHSRSPRRRRSRSKSPLRRNKRSPDNRSPRRRSRRKSERSPSPTRRYNRSPMLSMESVTLKSLKTKAEPQQISTISGISSMATKKEHQSHMDEYPDDVPHEMVSASSTNQTALRTLVDISTTNHKPPLHNTLIQIQTIQEPVKKLKSPQIFNEEEELSPPPPPPPPPKLLTMQPSPKQHVTKVNGNDVVKHECTNNKETIANEGENGGVTAILNFIGLNPQEKSAAQNAILSIAELSKHLQLDKIVEPVSATSDIRLPLPPAPLPDEDDDLLSPVSIDNIESSAVDLFNKGKKVKYVQKLKFRDRVVEEAKQAIKPFYEKREINKEEYKDIMKRAVNKICSNEAGSYEVNNVKIRRLIRRYIEKYQERNQKKKEKMRIKLEGKYQSYGSSQSKTDDFEEAPSPPENLDSITIPVSTPTLLKREPRKVVTLPDLPLPPPPPPPKPKYWK